MGKIVLFMNLTLDGVMQSPAGADEDQRGDFQQGGWAAPFGAMQAPEAGESLPSFGALLMGRWTYENFYSYWPHEKDSPFSEILNNMQKYVAATTLKEPLAWMNTTLLKGDLTQALTKLKAQQAEDIVIMGSGNLVQTLMRHNLIDRYLLLIHPIVLGSGSRLFQEDGAAPSLQLISAKATTNGVVVATYEPANR